MIGTRFGVARVSIKAATFFVESSVLGFTYACPGFRGIGELYAVWRKARRKKRKHNAMAKVPMIRRRMAGVRVVWPVARERRVSGRQASVMMVPDCETRSIQVRPGRWQTKYGNPGTGRMSSVKSRN